MKEQGIRKLLIANRGEIALRIIRTCRELGITTTAVFSDADRTSLHVLSADEAYPLVGVTAAETYLHQEKILRIAKAAKVDAIHPGYGFLSENPAFVQTIEEAGLTFVGPNANAIRTMGDKTEARKIARKLGIPTVAGTFDPLKDIDEALNAARQVGFPVILKAAAGGGGRGMRVAVSAEELPSLFRTARSEALSAFGDDRVYLEQYIKNPRHVEIQILGDATGTIVYLGERECSIQRRHQKLVEESPSAIMDDTLRREMGEAAVSLARSASYSNAGTVEFLVDDMRRFYFLETNTRLQVEHPVTEAVFGLDLVKEQLRIAKGRKLTFGQQEVRMRGHALECRVYAEDPENDFLPSTGTLRHYAPPEGPRVRVDNGYKEGDVVTVYYDPMMSKVITWGHTRIDAIASMKRALSEFKIEGVKSTIPFSLFVLSHEDFVRGEFNTGFVESRFAPGALKANNPQEQLVAAIAAVLLKLSNETRDQAQTNHRPNKDSKWKERRTEAHR